MFSCSQRALGQQWTVERCPDDWLFLQLRALEGCSLAAPRRRDIVRNVRRKTSNFPRNCERAYESINPSFSIRIVSSFPPNCIADLLVHSIQVKYFRTREGKMFGQWNAWSSGIVWVQCLSKLVKTPRRCTVFDLNFSPSVKIQNIDRWNLNFRAYLRSKSR